LADEAPVQAMLPFDLRHRDLQNADLSGVDLRYANLAGADLKGAKLTGANLEGANLEGANLERARLKEAALPNAKLGGANLTGANLARAYLQHATVARANLQGANLTGAHLRYANLTGANLRDANLRDADLTGANLLFEDATLVAKILFSGAKLTGARVSLQGLEERVQYEAAALNPNFNREGWRNVLKNIAGLHDDCRDTKRALMRAVVGVLDRARDSEHAAVEALVPSLADVLFEDPEYLTGHDAFSAWLCAGLLGNGSTPLYPMLSDTALKALDVYATRLLEAQGFKAIFQRRDAIFQVLHEVRQRAESAP
jgi:hypothetical protein